MKPVPLSLVRASARVSRSRSSEASKLRLLQPGLDVGCASASEVLLPALILLPPSSLPGAGRERLPTKRVAFGLAAGASALSVL